MTLPSADPRPLEANEFCYIKGNIDGGLGAQKESPSAINVSPVMKQINR